MKKILLLLFLLLSLLQSNAQFDTLDSTFNSTGLLLLPAKTFASAFQSGARLLTTRLTSDSLIITRYKADGTLDAAFGASGSVVIRVPGLTTITRLALKVQTDNDYIIMQVTGDDLNGNKANILLRLTPDGTKDSSFGSDGFVRKRYDSVSSLLVERNRKIVIVTKKDIAVYTVEGAFESLRELPSQYTEIGANGVGDDGSVVIETLNKSDRSQLLLRFNNDGTTTSFFLPTLALHSKLIYTVAVQPDGKVVAGVSPSSDLQGHLVRFNTDGTLDNSFGDHGISESTGQYIFEILFQNDGKIIVRGTGNDNFNLNITRFDSNGDRDSDAFNGYSFTEIRGYFNDGGITTIAGNRLYFGGHVSDYIIYPILYTGEILLALNLKVGCTPPTFKNDPTIVLAASCANNDGNISIIPTSGTAPFMYSKDGGATYVAGSDSGSGFQGLSAGVYELRLKDANGCESAIVEKEVKLNCATTCTPPTFKNDLTIVLDASCANNDGNISIIPTSGTAPFMYSKDGGATYISGSDLGSGFQGLSPGVYRLRLKDAKGCESAIIEREVKLNCPTTCTPPTFKNDLTIVLDASCANNDGQISIIPTSGTAPFMYSKDGGATYVSGSDLGSGFQGLSAGVYKLRLKDAKGCESAIIEREVKLNCPITCTLPTFKNDGTIVLDASCGNNDGNITIVPMSGSGPFMYSINGGTTYITGADYGYTFANLSAGTYQLRLKDAKGCESAIVERTVRNYYGCSGVIVASTSTDQLSLAANKEAISTYPNPSKGQFRLQLHNSISTKADISVINPEGRLIEKRIVQLVKTNTIDFDLKGRPKGMYYIKITSNNGTRTSKVLIQ